MATALDEKTTSRPITRAFSNTLLSSREVGRHPRAHKADQPPPFWHRDSLTLQKLLQGAWDEVSPDTVKGILEAFKANEPATIEKLLEQLKDLGSDFVEALGDAPEAVFSNLLLKAEAYWTLHAKEIGIEEPKTILESYRENMAKAWGEQIKTFSEAYPERILEPEITRQLEYLVETKTPSALQIDGIVEKLERLTDGGDYFKNLSDVQIARAFQADGIKNADGNGIGTCQGVGPVDEKTCPVCLNLIGVEIDVAKMLEKIDSDLDIEDPDAYAEAWSFPRIEDIGGLPRADLKDLMEENGWLPPWHPHCRHSVGWLYAKEEGEKPKEETEETEEEAA